MHVARFAYRRRGFLPMIKTLNILVLIDPNQYDWRRSAVHSVSSWRAPSKTWMGRQSGSNGSVRNITTADSPYPIYLEVVTYEKYCCVWNCNHAVLRGGTALKATDI